jgi:glycosyltransferase involved in cell wall biosynthesis
MSDSAGESPRARRIRVLYVVSQSVRWISFEWLAERLDRRIFDLSFLLLSPGPPPLASYLKALGVEVTCVPCRGRRDAPRVALEVARHCRSRGIDIAHAHFMDACLGGLTGARLADVPVRIHTRHHAGPYPAYHRPPWGRLYDRWNNLFSTAVVAPSEQARRALVEHDGVDPAKVVMIHHGFDLDALDAADDDDVDRMRRKYGMGDDRPVIGVVARYERIKGVVPIIDGFRRLLATYPKARLVLANARGRQSAAIRQQLATLPEGRFTEIPFEEQMPALYKTFDVFAHAPSSPSLEAFGQVYVEAMAAGVPCVCSIAGVAGEYLIDGENAVVVDPLNGDRIHDGLVRVLGDAALRQRLGANGRSSVRQRFGIDRMIRSLESLYVRLLESPRPGELRG